MEVKLCQNFNFWLFLSFTYMIFRRGAVLFCYARYICSFYVNKPQVNITWHHRHTWHSLIAHCFAMGSQHDVKMKHVCLQTSSFVFFNKEDSRAGDPAPQQTSSLAHTTQKTQRNSIFISNVCLWLQLDWTVSCICFVFGSQMMEWAMNLNSEFYMIINECEDCHYVLKLSELSKPYI